MTALHYEDGSVENCEIGIVNGKVPEEVEKCCKCSVGLWRNLTNKTYLLAAMGKNSERLYVLSEAKTYDRLNTNIDYGCPIIANANLSSAKKVSDDVCPPTHLYNIGDNTSRGIVIAYSDNRCYYYIKNPRGEYSVFHWHEVFDADCQNYERLDVASNTPSVPISYFNMCIGELFHKKWYFGIDDHPEYQRSDVWTLEQQVNLIDSIFNGIPIGAIVVCDRDWKDENEPYEEIIDGKQRFKAIIDFVSDKFLYRGKLYSKLHPFDRQKFTNAQISIGELYFPKSKYDRKRVLETFIKLNIGGTSMDKETIDRAKMMLYNLE